MYTKFLTPFTCCIMYKYIWNVNLMWNSFGQLNTENNSTIADLTIFYLFYFFFLAAIIPEFQETLRKAQVVEGKNARFECEVIGTPRPEVSW